MPSVGSILEGRYEILAQLAEGSFGQVYKGRQRSTGQAVAIKVLRFWEEDAPANVENQIARFRREMRLCAELSHPNIVRLFDSGETENGRLYAVFEYVPGSTLREVLAREGSLGWSETVHLMTQVLDALSCAHARGVVHRDLKPENIMVTKTGARRNALVLDFGLGGLLRDTREWALPRLTVTCKLMGTPCYAAPEQLRGEVSSPRSDLYSWGLIFLECLTGELVVSGKSVQEVVLKQLSPEPVSIPPAIRSGRLRRLLQKVTAKQVERRDVTIEALLQTLTLIDAEELQGPRGLTAAATPSAVDGERRQLTVLFCDLVGSTELSARLDPEEYREVVRAYQRSAEEVVARFGGQVGKYLGDGLLVYFGWPKAREDDAECAIRAGLALPGAVGALNERLPPGVRLAVRVGMHTGTVVVGEDVFGETPNVAARVQQLASPDTVVITAETHRLVAGLFVVEECATHTLRGVPGPVALYRVMRPSGVRSRFHARATEGLTPFVGRDEERRLLRQRLEQAREGEGQVVLLVGEPGIGKSRLAQVLHEDLAGTPHTWLESGGVPYFSNTPFYAVTELLNQFLAGATASEPEARVGALARALETAGLKPIETVPLVAPLLDLPVPKGYPPVLVAPEVARKRLLATLAEWVFGAARLQPMVILLEDLQWVDPSTLELQQLLVEQGATAPLLLLYTARPEFLPPWPPRAHTTQLTLNRLQRSHAREMVTRVTARALPAEVIEAVVAHTDGVPLFVEELTKAAAEVGARGAREIPATLADSLMARLDRLGPAAKEVAQVGAVLGRKFGYGLLHAVHPTPEAELEAALGKLADAELLYARGLPPESTYAFKHALVQDAAYGSLLKSRRRELHGLVAKVLAEHSPEVAEVQPELLAHHYTQAGDAEPAVAAWQRAGELALARGAPGEAERYLRRGLEVLGTLAEDPTRDGREFRLQLALGAALLLTGGIASPELAEAFGRARRLGERVAEPAQLVLILMGLWVGVINREGPAAARPLADEALAAAERAGLPAVQAWAHFAQGLTRYFAGDLAGAREHFGHGLALYDEGTALPGPTDPRIATLGYAALTFWHLGMPDAARAHARAGVEQAKRTGRLTDRASAHYMAAALHARLREPEMVLEHADLALAACAEEPNPTLEPIARILRGWALAQEGRGEAVIAMMREGVERLAATGQRLALEAGLDRLADALVEAGSVGEALAVLGEAEDCAPGNECARADTLRLRAELLARRGADATQVEATFRDAFAVARRQGAKAFELRTATSYAAWLRYHGRAAEGRDLLAPVYAWFTEGFDTRDLIEAKALLDQLT